MPSTDYGVNINLKAFDKSATVIDTYIKRIEDAVKRIRSADEDISLNVGIGKGFNESQSQVDG
jgi:hypothetical protein